MKYTFYLGLASAFLLFVLIPSSVLAAPLGTWFDPIHVEVELSPNDRFLQQRGSIMSQENALKAQYGLTNYYFCTSQSGGSDVNFVRYCLERKVMAEERTRSSTCPSGYVVKNGGCVTPDAGCKLTYGQGAEIRSLDASGTPICSCSDGYGWSVDGSSCESKSARFESLGTIECTNGWVWSKSEMKCVQPIAQDNASICRNHYGAYSVWTGELNENNTPLCGCAKGYGWNGDVCVLTPKEVPQAQPEREASPTLNSFSASLPLDSNNIFLQKSGATTIGEETPRERLGAFEKFMLVLRAVALLIP